MNKKVLETEFVDVYFDEESNRLINRWKEKTTDLTEESFKEVVFKMTDTVKDCKPTYMLADTLVYDFVVTPELQEWAGIHYFAPAIEVGLKKLAFLVPTDFFTEISIQQMMEEEKALGIKVKYFDKEEEAMNWLQS